LLAVLSQANAADKQFMDFILTKVHKRNFHGCDEAFIDIFKTVSGSDIQVSTDINPDAKNQIRVSSVYGRKGDTVYIDVLVTKNGKKCIVTETSMTTSRGMSCTASLADSKPFEYKSETLDYIFAQNSGGVDLMLTQAGDSCVKIFKLNKTY
jgi:hypothetical protein